MSMVKHPDEKKLLSLKHDRRNVYGENYKSSRKNIPLSKRRSNKSARASVAQVLFRQSGPTNDIDFDGTQDVVAAKEILIRRKRFKKRPDAPLFTVLVESKTELPAGSIPWETNVSMRNVIRIRQMLRDRNGK